MFLDTLIMRRLIVALILLTMCGVGSAQQAPTGAPTITEQVMSLPKTDWLMSFKDVKVDNFVVMPNHIHMLITIGCDALESDDILLKEVLGHIPTELEIYVSGNIIKKAKALVPLLVPLLISIGNPVLSSIAIQSSRQS